MSRDRSKDPPKSAAELMRELQRDPDYVARMQKREREHQEGVEAYSRAVEPLMQELAASGVQFESLGELRQSGTDYRSAVPILLRWLSKIDDAAVKEDVVRTLSVPSAKPTAAPALVEEFKKANYPHGDELRWAIANGLAVVADDSVFEELVELVRDRRNGKAREMLALGLANMENPSAVAVLMGLLEDEQTVGHAVMALGKLKAVAARARLESLTQHPTEWVREEAKKALTNLGQSRLN